jgi:C-terminal processing protease CtpA/Prc
MFQMASVSRLGLVLDDDGKYGVRVTKIEDYAVVEGTCIRTGDVILKINGLDAKSNWRNLLKSGPPNSPFRLQFRSQVNNQVSTCVIYKQIVSALSEKTYQPAAAMRVSFWSEML